VRWWVGVIERLLKVLEVHVHASISSYIAPDGCKNARRCMCRILHASTFHEARRVSIKILRREPFRAATMRPERPGTHVQRIDVRSTKSLGERCVDEKGEKEDRRFHPSNVKMGPRERAKLEHAAQMMGRH
jgi:hypothetical protein